MRLSPGLRWTILALAGLAVAVAIGITAGKLTSERVGLASEPLDIGESLAPRTGGQRADGGRPEHDRGGGHGERRTTTASEPSTVSSTSSITTSTGTTTATDDSGGGESEGDDD